MDNRPTPFKGGWILLFICGAAAPVLQGQGSPELKLVMDRLDRLEAQNRELLQEIKALQQTCAQSKIFAHIGFNERSAASVGCIYNSAVLISDKGEILNHQRKLVPT